MIVNEALSSWVANSKAAATRYVVNEPISSSDCHRTMTRSREPCMCRHTLLVTRTDANEYTLTLAGDGKQNNDDHGETMEGNK